MRTFTHFNASTVDEAISVLRRYGKRARIIAGGTDLLGVMKDDILPDYPAAVVNIKPVNGLDGIEMDGGCLKIGALARLESIASSRLVKDSFPALAEAARRTASTHIREMGTLGGNICQDIRCWYYRSPGNRFPCLRKGGGKCYAINGDNRYHSIFGGSVEQGCYAVHPSDTAPALIALDARMKTTKRTVRAKEFFTVGVCRTTILDEDEIITGVEIPLPPEGSKSCFSKFAIRKTIDFPIVNCALSIYLSDNIVKAVCICLNAVYVIPYQVVPAEEAMIGKEINEKNAAAAGEAAISNAKPLRYNKYMVQIAKTMVKNSILACAES